MISSISLKPYMYHWSEWLRSGSFPHLGVSCEQLTLVPTNWLAHQVAPRCQCPHLRSARSHQQRNLRLLPQHRQGRLNFRYVCCRVCWPPVRHSYIWVVLLWLGPFSRGRLADYGSDSSSIWDWTILGGLQLFASRREPCWHCVKDS